MATLMLAVAVVALAAVLVWSRRDTIRGWFRRPPQGEPCEVCGTVTAGNVTVTAATDRSSGGVTGGSSISATWCPEHAPASSRSLT